jgi:hypothetical protein
VTKSCLVQDNHERERYYIYSLTLQGPSFYLLAYTAEAYWSTTSWSFILVHLTVLVPEHYNKLCFLKRRPADTIYHKCPTVVTTERDPAHSDSFRVCNKYASQIPKSAQTIFRNINLESWFSYISPVDTEEESNKPLTVLYYWEVTDM